MPLLKKSCWTHSLTFLAGLICGSLFLSGHVTRRYTRGGEVGRILQSSTGNEVGCPVEALSASTGQGVHSFMTQEFKKATSPNSDKVLTHHYELMYAPFLARFHHTPLKLLEIGVEKGNSIPSWERLFPKIDHVYGVGYGVDVKEKTWKRSLDQKKTLFYADQSNASQLENIVRDIGRESVDVIVDDGSHIPWHQILTFDIFFRDLLAPGGTYIIEDVETSYWSNPTAQLYGYKIVNAGVGQKGSAMEKFKSLADVINRKYMARPDFSVMGATKVDHLVSSVSFSRNCIIIEKMNPLDGWSKKTLKTRNYAASGYIDRANTDKYLADKEVPITGLPL